MLISASIRQIFKRQNPLTSMAEEPEKLGKIFDKHIEYEFKKEDVEATMTTMTDEPYVHHVPTLTGGL